MMTRLVLGLAVLTSCLWTEPTPVGPNDKPTPITAPAASKITVDLTAVTLADDCGGTAPAGPPAAPARKADRANDDAPEHQLKSKSEAKRRCEQTSMQLAVAATADGSPTKLVVKRVEMFDDTGTSLGELAASTPTYWSKNGMYEAWDEAVAPGSQLAVSYVLARPDWDRIQNRRNRTFTLKVTVTIGNSDQAMQKDVQTISAPTSLPPNVKT